MIFRGYSELSYEPRMHGDMFHFFISFYAILIYREVYNIIKNKYTSLYLL